VVWFFPQFAVGVVTVAVISDALASLVGKAFGRVKIKNKSLEGFLAYAISAYFILTYFDIPYAFFGALVGALTELFNIPPDDNFSCQIAMAVALYLVNWLSF
jgi:dolichol kinase